MTTPTWQAGTLYPNGFLVKPASAPPPAATAIPNAGFESGDTGWTKGTGWTINSGDQPFQGTWSAKYNNTGTTNLDMDTTAAVAPGQSITASCMVQQGASSAGQAGATVALVWLTAADAVISVSEGTTVDSASGGAWKQSTVTAVAPATAAKVFVRAIGFRDSGSNPLWVDSFTWNFIGAVAPAGLIYRAVQTGVGTSDSEEPTWPLTLGVQVVDGTVTWEAVSATRVTCQASPLLTTSGTEPTWPTAPGETVLDNNILWECVSRRVEDTNCPNTTVVAILASKVFAADGDIVRFSETANPLNWTTEQDAGYLPTGLQQANANDMAVLNQYRSNLVAFNASSFQNWYVDPDPANMSILDQMDGIGSTWQQAARAVGNELFYLSQLGVRSVGIANAAENLSAGDVGQPIDPLVRAAIAESVQYGLIPVATYYPGAGQYWLAFTEFEPTPYQDEISLWGEGIGSGGPALNKTETFNAELVGATSVSIIGYWPNALVFTYPPGTDPLAVTPDSYGTYTVLATAIDLSTSTGAGTNYWALGSQSADLPAGGVLAVVLVNGTTYYLAAINNSGGF